MKACNAMWDAQVWAHDHLFAATIRQGIRRVIISFFYGFIILIVQIYINITIRSCNLILINNVCLDVFFAHQNYMFG